MTPRNVLLNDFFFIDTKDPKNSPLTIASPAAAAAFGPLIKSRMTYDPNAVREIETYQTRQRFFFQSSIV